jgi:hypothetical protein
VAARAGARISRIVFWPPQTSHVGIGASLLSYAGEITVGVNADTALVPQPRRLVDAFLTELGVMLARTPKRGVRRAAGRWDQKSVALQSSDRCIGVLQGFKDFAAHIAVGHSPGLGIVAESFEHAEQFDFMRAWWRRDSGTSARPGTVGRKEALLLR